MQGIPQHNPLPDQFSNLVREWEMRLINDVAIHMLVTLQEGTMVTDMHISTSMMVRDVLLLTNIPQSAYIKAKYHTTERAVYYICYAAATQLNVDRTFYRYGPPPLPVSHPVQIRPLPTERTTGDYHMPATRKRFTRDLRDVATVANMANAMPPETIEQAIRQQERQREHNG